MAGEEILSNGEVTVGQYDLITFTLTATDKDGGTPANDSAVTPLSGAAGFVGVGTAATDLKTNDAGEVRRGLPGRHGHAGHQFPRG